MVANTYLPPSMSSARGPRAERTSTRRFKASDKTSDVSRSDFIRALQRIKKNEETAESAGTVTEYLLDNVGLEYVSSSSDKELFTSSMKALAKNGNDAEVKKITDTTGFGAYLEKHTRSLSNREGNMVRALVRYIQAENQEEKERIFFGELAEYATTDKGIAFHGSDLAGLERSNKSLGFLVYLGKKAGLSEMINDARNSVIKGEKANLDEAITREQVEVDVKKLEHIFDADSGDILDRDGDVYVPALTINDEDIRNLGFEPDNENCPLKVNEKLNWHDFIKELKVAAVQGEDEVAEVTSRILKYTAVMNVRYQKALEEDGQAKADKYDLYVKRLEAMFTGKRIKEKTKVGNVEFINHPNSLNNKIKDLVHQGFVRSMAAENSGIEILTKAITDETLARELKRTLSAFSQNTELLNFSSLSGKDIALDSLVDSSNNQLRSINPENLEQVAGIDVKDAIGEDSIASVAAKYEKASANIADTLFHAVETAVFGDTTGSNKAISDFKRKTNDEIFKAKTKTHTGKVRLLEAQNTLGSRLFEAKDLLAGDRKDTLEILTQWASKVSKESTELVTLSTEQIKRRTGAAKFVSDDLKELNKLLQSNTSTKVELQAQVDKVIKALYNIENADLQSKAGGPQKKPNAPKYTQQINDDDSTAIVEALYANGKSSSIASLLTSENDSLIKKPSKEQRVQMSKDNAIQIIEANKELKDKLVELAAVDKYSDIEKDRPLIHSNSTVHLLFADDKDGDDNETVQRARLIALLDLADQSGKLNEVVAEVFEKAIKKQAQDAKNQNSAIDLKLEQNKIQTQYTVNIKALMGATTHQVKKASLKEFDALVKLMGACNDRATVLNDVKTTVNCAVGEAAGVRMVNFLGAYGVTKEEACRKAIETAANEVENVANDPEVTEETLYSKALSKLNEADDTGTAARLFQNFLGQNGKSGSSGSEINNSVRSEGLFDKFEEMISFFRSLFDRLPALNLSNS